MVKALYLSNKIDQIENLNDRLLNGNNKIDIIHFSPSPAVLQLLQKDSFDAIVFDGAIEKGIINKLSEYFSKSLKKPQIIFIEDDDHSNNYDIIRTIAEPLIVKRRDVPETVLHLLSTISESKQKNGITDIGSDILQKLIIPVVVMDLNTNVISFNNSAEKLFRFSWQEAVGKKVGDLLKVVFGNNHTCRSFTDIVELKNSLQCEIQAYTKDDEKLYIKLDTEPVTDENGNTTCILCVFTDLTEIKENENKLHLLSNVVLHASDGIVVTDLYDNIIFINESKARMSGFTTEEVVGKDVLIFAGKNASITIRMDEVSKELLEKGTWTGELEEITKDGRKIIISLSNRLLYDEEGRACGIVGVSQDITERKIIEKQAYISEVKYRQLFEESKDFIFETSVNGKFISINQAGVDLLGYSSKEEMLQIDIAKDLYVNSDDRDRFKLEVANKGYVVDFEVELKKKNGEKRTFIETSTAVYDDRGAIIGFRGIGKDVTEKKKHQERILSLLVASQALSRSTTDEEIFDTIAKAIRRLGHNLMILLRKGIFLNIVRTTFDAGIIRGFEKNYNFRLDSLQIPIKNHPNFRQVIEQKKTIFNDKAIERLFEILPSNIPQNIIQTIAEELGYKKYSILLPLIVFNEVIGVALINSDEFTHEDIPVFNLYSAQLNAALENARLYSRVTKANEDLKKAYEKLHESQNLLIHSEKLKAIGDLASGVAHDFNNLLGVIFGRTQLLQLRATDQKVKQDLEIILKAAMDGAETVKRLQDFAKQKVDDNASVIDVNMIIEDAIQLTQTKWKDYAQQKGVYIGIKKEFAGLPIILGSGAELREILTNLLLNAVDAMPSGGTITIRTLNQDRLYSIEVEDTGIGMDSTTRLRIFDPFFTTKGNRGTGLGLAMVKTLVNKRQGEISVISKQGTGTKFTITFPKLNIVNEYLNKPNFTTSEIVKDMNLQPMKILIIDDEEEIRILLAEILINANYDVVLACDGREGVEKFKSGNIDIVFTDLGMSELNGWEVAKIVKTIKPNTPVVLISGWGSDLKDQDIKGTGVDFLASKPFHIDEIFKLLILAKKYIKDKKKDISV